MKKHKQKMIDTNGFSETGIQTVVRLTSLMHTVFLALFFLLLFQYHSFAQDNGSTIQVGIFQNYPIKVFCQHMSQVSYAIRRFSSAL